MTHPSATKTINQGVRLCPQERDILEQAARKLDRPVSWLMRQASLERARQILGADVEQRTTNQAA